MPPKTNKDRKGRILIFSLVFLSVCIGINAEAQKSSWAVPASATGIENPLAGNTSVLGNAKVLYVGNCSPCHGKRGKGDGPAAAALKIKPADHTSAKVQSMSDGSLYWMIATGHTPMPSYKTALTTKQKWELVNYIRTMANK